MDFTISQLMQMQKALHKLHENEWHPMEPEYGRNCILYMIEEIGESIAILKKKGDISVVANPDIRAAFLEEMSDVLMYYMDALLRYHITPEEISEAYLNKHLRNMGRNYSEEYKEKYTHG